MKRIHIISAGVFFCAVLASCEMKNEIFGDDNIPSETGWVELGVKVNNKTNVVVTRGTIQGEEVDPADFPVVFALNNSDYTKEFDTYENLLEEEKVELPVGNYTVSSHTPGTLTKRMDHPYYSGEENLTVSKDITSDATVTCTMQNSRILLTYDNTFTSKFKTWTITIDDGTNNILKYTEADGTNLQAVYWLFEKDCTAIKINISATTTSGATVTESRTITKPDDATTDSWVGGDALTITMVPGPDEETPTGVSGIIINVNAFFETEKNETVDVPVEGEDTETPTDPDEGGDTTDPDEGEGDNTPAAPTLSGENLGKTVSYDKGSGKPFPEVSVEMTVPGKIEKVMIKATSSDSKLAEILAEMGFMDNPDGVDMVTSEDLAGLFTPPAKGDPSYTFTLGALGNMLTVGQHTFTVKVIDQNSKEVTGTLSFNITDSSAN